MKWDKDLTGSHLAIAKTDDTPLRVVAGPGTGKTFALMRRVTRLLEAGSVNPKRLLVCTFTRTAASDLAGEIAGLGVPGAENIWAGTLHAYCFGLLSRGEVLQTTGRVPRPLLDFESRFMLQDLQHEGMGGIRKCKKSLQAFNAAWARLQTDDPGWPHEETDRTFQNGLLSWLRFHRCMLIGELVPEAVRYLRDNPESQDRHAFDHVLVDEYQDLNRAEQVILDLLTGDGDLTIVGDEDQSIYSFKFAHPEGIAEFPTTHPGTHDEDLLECRRCHQIIVDMANSLIAHNAIRSPRTLTCHKGCPEGEVAVVQWRDMKQEAVGIALTIHERVKRGDVAPGRVLILAPRRQIGYAVRDALNEFGTPAHSFFNEEVFDGRPQDLGASRSQQAFTLLNLLASPEDVVSLRCWCGFGTNSLQSPAWTRLRSHCLSNNVEPHEALGQLVAGKIRIPHTRPLASRYADLQTRLIELADVCGQELIDALFPESEAWAEPFRQVSRAEDEDGDPIDPKSLLADLRTRAIQPELPTDVEYVRVMSLHKSKGLTADMVVVLGCTRGMIPAIIPDHLSPAEQQRFIEEQRRLFFVALTRSRGVLILSNFANMPRDVANRMRVPVRGGTPTDAQTFASAFLGELGHSRPETLKGRAFLDSMGINVGS